MERDAGLLAELAPVLDGGHVGCPVNVLQPLGGVRRYEELVSEEGGFIKSFVRDPGEAGGESIGGVGLGGWLALVPAPDVAIQVVVLFEIDEKINLDTFVREHVFHDASCAAHVVLLQVFEPE